MKILSRLAPVFLGLAACQSNPTTPATPSAAPATTSTTASTPLPAAPKAPANPEYADAATFSISGLPDSQLTTKEFTRQLGRPDSIAKGAVECGSRLANIPMDAPDGDSWYYGKTMYEVSGTQAVLCSFDVTTGRFKARLGKLVLDKNTTLEAVRRLYPESAKQADEPAGPGRTGEVMSLPFIFKGEGWMNP
ncbi:hypothetical protein MON38_01155 [Hymenobacter sp. DH14]|uniref:Lipoprotein n=1 Tax=Hymenobacter cyanobacteriorum TaxID=2926463 RepID=A0A9X2AGQ2_9BACT|nr:hypothetical protein [Hymenobacter cyanobacteriorum]MCI1186009.1 hypothetical protein [Hymenobacter cyanobacteriorum]